MSVKYKNLKLILASALALCSLLVAATPPQASADAPLIAPGCSSQLLSGCKTDANCKAAGGVFANNTCGSAPTSKPTNLANKCSAEDTSGCTVETCQAANGSWDPTAKSCTITNTTDPAACAAAKNNVILDSNGVDLCTFYRDCQAGTIPSTDQRCLGVGEAGNCSDTQNLQRCDLISKYINPLIAFLSALVGVAVAISIIIGGIQYASSAGDPQAAAAAKARIRNAIIALLGFIFLFALLNFLVPGGLF